MAAYKSVTIEDRVYTVTSHPTVGLDMKPYVEYRLEHRDTHGLFVGYVAFGSKEFCEGILNGFILNYMEDLARGSA